MIVLSEIFEQVAGRGLVVDLEVSPGALTWVPGSVEGELRRLTARSVAARRRRVRIPKPTIDDIRTAAGLAFYVTDVNLLDGKGELVAGTGDLVSAVSFVASSAQDLEETLARLRSR